MRKGRKKNITIGGSGNIYLYHYYFLHNTYNIDLEIYLLICAGETLGSVFYFFICSAHIHIIVCCFLHITLQLS